MSMPGSIVTIVMLLCIIGCGDQSVKDTTTLPLVRRIKSKSHGLFNGFHGGERTSLIIDGKEFTHVAGLPPYYLKVPGTNAIVFQTLEGIHGTYHVYFLDTRTHVPIRAEGVSFGGGIGLDVPDDKAWIVGLSSNVLVLGDRFMHIQNHRYLDLNQRKVLKDEVWLYDKNGNLTNHVIYEPPIGY